MSEKKNPIRETDEAARKQARLLLRGSRFGAIAAMDPQTGYPNCSRVLLGTANDGAPVILVSELSAHTKALLADPRSSLLVGEPGKGDPLAWPRLTVQCDAQPIERQSDDDQAIRSRFIRRHHKAALYADFADFLFIRLNPVRASLNGGFGKAYLLSADDLKFEGDCLHPKDEEALLKLANQDWKELAQENDLLKEYQNWSICGVDAEGIDLKKGDRLARIPSRSPIKEEAAKTAINRGFFTLISENW